MLRASNVLRLVLVFALLAVLAIPVIGITAANSVMADVQSIESNTAHGQPGIELVCIPGDPGSSGGNDGGC